jgi:hypothetical protein
MFLFGAFFIVWLFMIVISIGFLIVYILYLITFSRTLELCHPHTRKMNPGEVWMVLIPVYGIVWQFIMIGRLADSLAIEFRNRNLPVHEERPGYSAGITAHILLLCGGIIPVLGLIVAIIFFIRYWNLIGNYKKQLEQHNAMSGGNAFAFQQAQNYQQQYPQQYPPQYPPQHPSQYQNQFPPNQPPHNPYR